MPETSVLLSREAGLSKVFHQVFLGIGSNINPERNIRQGLEDLRKLDKHLKVSRTYQSESFGFEGPPFLNLAALMTISRELSDLVSDLKEIEFNHGREPDLSKYSSRTLDIDILMFDDLSGVFGETILPRPEITKSAYVLKPLADLAPTVLLPGSSTPIGTLWREFDQHSQPVIERPICW